MAADTGGLVVTGRDISLLLRSLGEPGLDIEAAISLGVVRKDKVEGRWLYFAAGVSIERVRSQLALDANRVVGAWFIAPLGWVPGIIAKRNSTVTKDAAEVLLHQLVREQAFGAIGLLSRRDQPYLALHLPDDAKAVEQRVMAMEDVLSRRGLVTYRELPASPRPTQNQGWRATLLRHGEFLGLGVYKNWELHGWSVV